MSSQGGINICMLHFYKPVRSPQVDPDWFIVPVIVQTIVCSVQGRAYPLWMVCSRQLTEP